MLVPLSLTSTCKLNILFCNYFKTANTFIEGILQFINRAFFKILCNFKETRIIKAIFDIFVNFCVFRYKLSVCFY